MKRIMLILVVGVGIAIALFVYYILEVMKQAEKGR